MSVTPEPEFTEWHHTDVPAVPPGRYRDADPRSREELITARLAGELIECERLHQEDDARRVLELIEAAFARCGTETYRDEFMAALLAVLASNDEPVREEAPRGYCTRPGCERLAHRDALGHLGTDGEPVCTSAQTDHGNFTNRVCTRALGHLGHHTYVMWYGLYAQTQLDR